MSPPRHPARAHLVAVATADDQVRGSGYLLGSRLVLTAGHVVATVPPGELRVCRVATLRTTSARILRIERDIALLQTDEDVADPAELAPIAMRQFSPDSRFDDCSALGLPTVMTRLTAGVAPLEAAFRVSPNTADAHGYLSLELDGHPPDGPTPWRGMSGAPVFHAGRWLVGVIVRDSANWSHSRLEAAPIGAFFDAVPLADAVFRVPNPLTESDARDAAFLDSYRKELIRRYGHIELFGLGAHGHLADDIGIDHAYVSLRAGLPTLGRATNDQARPIEQLVPKNSRLLLRGDPGAGKSTFLEWLAVTMARRACTGPLEPFNDRVPFVIRLRDMYAPRWKQVEGRDGIPPQPDQFLEFARLSTDTAPPHGWVRRTLEQDRALLLVDGLDEVLEGHRDGVLRWIQRLLRDHPALHIIVTGRPEALLQWNARDTLRFVELKLLELDADRRAELIHKWHRAAIIGVRSARLGDEESERRVTRLAALETTLTRHIDESADLSALAATPLLCAVLCKLHEVHGARLPRFRQELYARTIDMMLGLRDADRAVPDPIPRLEVDQRRAILSWVAGYLTTEGEREITSERFDEKVRDRLPSLGRDAGGHTPEEIRRALQERSGLLVTPSEDILRFSHRTFQDYLAATDMVAQRAFGQLAGHTGEETWDDVLHFAMSQCSLADTGEFVAQIRKKLRLVTNRRQRARMRMAAASCIPYAVQMGEDDRDWLISGVAKSFQSARVKDGGWDYGPYAALGPDLLAAFQRDFDWHDVGLCEHAINLSVAIGGPEGFRFLTQIPSAMRAKVADRLADAWSAFPGREYADEVLAGLELPALHIDSADRLAHAAVVGRVLRLRVSTCPPLEAVADFVHRHRVAGLAWSEGALEGVPSFGALTKSPGLRSLYLGAPDRSIRTWFQPPSYPFFRGRSGEVENDAPEFSLPALPGLRELAVLAMPRDWTTHAGGWTSLEGLGLYGDAAYGIGLLKQLPALTHLFVASDVDYAIPTTLAHPGATHLALHWLDDAHGRDLPRIPTAFPGLTELVLVSHTDAVIDLTGLERMPGLIVRIIGRDRSHGGVLGGQAFPRDRLRWK